MQLTHPALATCKAIFAIGLDEVAVSPGHVLFNAPRPLLGSDIACTEFRHGRFYSGVDLGDSYASSLIEKNASLDARVVIRVTKTQALQLVLAGNKYAAKYRELPLDKQYSMLLPSLSDYQGRPYPEAVTLLRELEDASAATARTE
jgi:hypothetical protein